MREIIIDTNIFLLLVVGSTSKDYIEKHKRIAHSKEDYDLLIELLLSYDKVVITPNTMTETSNLIAHIGGPIKEEVFLKLEELVSECQEYYVASKSAAGNAKFVSLGLTDAVLLEVGGETAVLLTEDFELHGAATALGKKTINFRHVIEARGGYT